MAKIAEKECTISYFRATWQSSPPEEMTLEQALRACLNSLPNVTDTRLKLRDGLAEVRHRQITKNKLRLHIAGWTDREAVSTVPHSKNQAEADLDSKPPGKNWDYLDGDGMLLISGNHYFVIPNKLHPGSLRQYICNLLDNGRNKGVNLPDRIENFRLTPVANNKVIKKLYREGVKKIDLNIGQYMETSRSQERVSSRQIVEQLRGNVLSTLKELLTKESDKRSIEEASNISAKLIIKIDKRKSGLTTEKLAEVAKKIATESEDEVSIVTDENNVIRRGQLVLKKKVRITTDAKSIHYNQAWEEMLNYLGELQELGALEE